MFENGCVFILVIFFDLNFEGVEVCEFVID